MNAQHTPGPWIWGPNARLYADVNLPECLRVKNVGINKTTALCWDEKDARLIAAAPDLLNALQIAENALDIYSGGESLDLAAIRIAIAKATGSST